MDYKSAFTNKLHDENRKETLRLMSLILIFFAVIEITLLVLNYLNIMTLYVEADNYVLIFSSTLTILASLFPWLFPKYLKVSFIILYIVEFVSVFILDYSFSYFIIGGIIIPVLISTRLYNKKITSLVILGTVVALFLSSLITWIVASNTQSSSYLLKIDFSNFKDTMVQNFLIKVISLFVPFVICFFLSSNGNTLLKKQGAITATAAALENDMKNASAIQKQILPVDFQIARNHNINIYAEMISAREVAGDFYDFFVYDDKFYFLIGDVSDKGLYSAMFMMNVKNTIRSIAVNNKGLENIINQSNKLICKDNKTLMFVTLWIGEINLKTNEAFYINAGHCPPYIKNADNKIIKIQETPQKFIGIFPDTTYKAYPLDIRVNESLVLYTDGVTDSLNFNEVPFEHENLINSIKKAPFEPEQLSNSIIDDLRVFTKDKDQYDDITLLTIKIDKYSFDKTLKCNHKNIDVVLDSLNKDLTKNNVNEDTINLINTALDDALDNVISYAYKNKEETFRVQYKIENQILTLVISDHGYNFNPLKIKGPDLSKTRPLGGLGLHLIKNIMDKVEYSRSETENILVLTKRL